MAALAFDLRHPALAAEELRAANQQLARMREVPGSIRELVNAVSDELITLDVETFAEDPYLLVAIERAALRAKRALDLDAAHAQRRAVRLALDDIHRLCVALAEREPVSAERDANAVAHWLVDTIGLAARQVAPLIGVHERTLQRWAAEPPQSAPSGKDERKLRSVAQVVAQLRHALTAPGVLAWMTQPDEGLGGQTPVERLEDPAGLPAVLATARRLRAVPFA
jgi:hypothetical protein